MKIICVGRNYVAHIEELNNERPAEPVIFTKPDTALLQKNLPFYYPEFSQDIHHEIELVLQICKQGKYIEERFANKYYDKIGLGIDFTARDLQAKAKAKGLPWAIAKGFNGSAPISKFFPIEQYDNVNQLDFSLKVNGELKQKGDSKLMIWTFDELIAYISQFFMLKIGDLIFTGTPAGVGAVQKGDCLEGFIEEQKVIDFMVK